MVRAKHPAQDNVALPIVAAYIFVINVLTMAADFLNVDLVAKKLTVQVQSSQQDNADKLTFSILKEIIAESNNKPAPARVLEDLLPLLRLPAVHRNQRRNLQPHLLAQLLRQHR